jgi:hypothetical protein
MKSGKISITTHPHAQKAGNQMQFWFVYFDWCVYIPFKFYSRNATSSSKVLSW